MIEGTKIGGLSSPQIGPDPIGSANQSPGGLPRQTQADSKKVRQAHLSPLWIRLDPIESAINWQTVHQKQFRQRPPAFAIRRLVLSPLTFFFYRWALTLPPRFDKEAMSALWPTSHGAPPVCRNRPYLAGRGVRQIGSSGGHNRCVMARWIGDVPKKWDSGP